MKFSTYQANARDQLLGSYKTELFVLNQDTLPPLTTDTIRWDKLIIDKYSAKLKYMNEHSIWVKVAVDSAQQSMELIIAKDTFQMKYHFPDEKSFHLMDTNKQDGLFVNMKVKKMEDYLLINQGFHWINEYPFNR